MHRTPSRPLPRPLDDEWLFCDPMQIAPDSGCQGAEDTIAPLPPPLRPGRRRGRALAALLLGLALGTACGVFGTLLGNAAASGLLLPAACEGPGARLALTGGIRS
jgi:hypothetical protein